MAACNNQGCSEFVGTTIILTPPPATPTNVVARNVGTDNIITWNDTATNETKYQIAWSNTQNGSNYTFVDLPAGTTSWTHTNVLPEMQYNYHVSACKGANCSPLVGTVVRTQATIVPSPTTAIIIVPTGIYPTATPQITMYCRTNRDCPVNYSCDTNNYCVYNPMPTSTPTPQIFR